MTSQNDTPNLLRLAKALWGWVPHPTQREWLIADARVKVAACGRRWGKTEAAAIDAAATAIIQPGSAQMIVSPTYDQSRLIFDQIERLMMGSRLTRGLTKITKTPYPRLSLGESTIMARTADDDGRNLRGHSADRVIVDEAAYVRDSVISEVVSPMLADRNGRLVMISTPFGKNHFYRAYMRGLEKSTSTASFSFPSWTNPHISRQYIEAQRSEISARQFSVEYEAAFIDNSNCIFAWDDIEVAACASPPVAHDVVVAGIDWARYSDYTAVIAISPTGHGYRVVAMDRFNKMGWNSQISRVVEFMRANRISSALTDSTSIGDPLLEQLRGRLYEAGLDIAVEGYTFSNQSKRELIEHLGLLFAHHSIAIPRDEHLLRELRYYEYELTSSGSVRMNGRQGIHDDLVIALALACRQARGFSVDDSYLSHSSRMAVEGW